MAIKIILPFVSRKKFEQLQVNYAKAIMECNKYMVNQVTNENYLPLKMSYDRLRSEHQQLMRDYDSLKERLDEQGKESIT